jgi:hypothetical protein
VVGAVLVLVELERVRIARGCRLSRSELVKRCQENYGREYKAAYIVELISVWRTTKIKRVKIIVDGKSGGGSLLIYKAGSVPLISSCSLEKLR